jgi:hypothetical protein
MSTEKHKNQNIIDLLTSLSIEEILEAANEAVMIKASEKRIENATIGELIEIVNEEDKDNELWKQAALRLDEIRNEEQKAETFEINVSCPMCEIIVINNEPCHETGCRYFVEHEDDYEAEDFEARQ